MSVHLRKHHVAANTIYTYFYSPSQADKPTLLFLHGFPSCKKDWMEQAEHFAKKGYGVLVPDLLGYGGTSKPRSVEAYGWSEMSKHIEALLDHEKVNRVNAFGHDLGSWFLSRLVHLLPDRISAIGFLDVGYNSPGEKFDVEMINKITKEMTGGEKFRYWDLFCADDGAALLDKHCASFLSLMHADPAVMAANLGPPNKVREWVEEGHMASMHWGDASSALFQDRVKMFVECGWTGPLNWYKALAGNVSYVDEEHMETKVNMPTLLIGCEQDQMTLASFQDRLTREAANGYYRYEVLQSGHWVMLEAAEDTNKLLEEFVMKVSTQAV